MGLSDIVPGVSGGTIALIAGIYERLIFAIKSINLRFIPHLLRATLDRRYLKKARRSFSSIDFAFLLPLVAGIGLAFLAASRVIIFVLSNYPAYIYSFFFGLILISAKIVYGRIEEGDFGSFTFGLIGFLFAFVFVGLENVAMAHGLPIIFAAGFLAVCAMLLPGVSGSFMVLFLGQYEYMLNALQSIRTCWVEIGVFLAGGLISLFSFSRVISHFLEKYRARTLFFLSGLMIGALRLPFEKVVSIPGLSQNPLTLLGAILSGLVGVFLLYLTTRKYSFQSNEIEAGD